MRTLAIVLLVTSYGLASDVTRGNELDALIRDSKPLYENPEVCARVNEIGQKLVAASGNKSGFPFHFYVLNSPDATTVSVPGGSVYVTTGLLGHLKSEDELAVMLGHEIAHINERHLMRAESSEHSKLFWRHVFEIGVTAGSIYAGAIVQAETAKTLGNTTVIVPAGQIPARTVTTRPMGLISSQRVPSVPKYSFLTTDPAGAQLASLTQVAVTLGTGLGGEALLNLYYQGYKDEYEFDADRLAVDYANKAGYNGNALLDVFNRFGGATAETSSAEVSHLHSSDETLAKRSSKAQTEVGSLQQHNH